MTFQVLLNRQRVDHLCKARLRTHPVYLQ